MPYGASAGGLLVGVALTRRPELWAGVLSAVGFVDAIVTASDPTIPLTMGEWDEWGNPNTKETYDYILQYDPMSNVRAVKYPPVLLTAGYQDRRVGFWEPVKFAARMRAKTTGDPGDILVNIQMDGGHCNPADRYENVRVHSVLFAWAIDLLTRTNSVRSISGIEEPASGCNE